MATKLFSRNHKDVFETVAEGDETASVAEGDETVSTPKSEIDSTATEPEAVDVDEPLDVAADAEEVESPAQEPEQPSRARRWLRRGLVGVAALIFVAALALAGFFGWQVKQQNEVRDAGKAALAQAQTYAAALTSIDTGNIDANFDQVLNGATGEFKDMYSQSASQLRKVLIDNKAMSKGIVVDSAIKSATKDKVDVLIFIDQSITNTVNPEPRIDRSRVAMTMELVDGRWLASQVDIK